MATPSMLRISGLHPAARVLAVYASCQGYPLTTQDSLPAAGQALPGGIGYPLGFQREVSVKAKSRLPPLPGTLAPGRPRSGEPPRLLGQPQDAHTPGGLGSGSGPHNPPPTAGGGLWDPPIPHPKKGNAPLSLVDRGDEVAC